MTSSKSSIINVRPRREPRIVNMVYNGHLEWWFPHYPMNELPLNVLSIVLCGRSDMKNFKSCIVHSDEPRCTIHIYPNGKFTVCGGCNEGDAIESMYLIISRLVMEMGLVAYRRSWKLQNVVMVFTTGFPIDNEAFVFYNPIKAIDDGLYCGLQYHPKGLSHPQPCYVIHTTGAVNGLAATEAEVLSGFSTMNLHLYELNKGKLSIEFQAFKRTQIIHSNTTNNDDDNNTITNTKRLKTSKK